MEYTTLMSCLNVIYDAKTKIVVKMSNGLVFISDDNTGSFESDNGKDLNDDKYKEYYAVGVKITKILLDDSKKYTEGQYVELSDEYNKPLEIIDADTSKVLWSASI